MDLVSKQREARRERILEVARRLIAERGFEGVTMRELADESLVSVPTLYNLFGGKNELLFSAMVTYLVAMVSGGDDPTADQEGLDKLIAMTERVSGETLNHAAYSRALMGFFSSSPEAAGRLYEFAAGQLSDIFEVALVQMQRKRQLASWADSRVVAERLSSQLIITTFEWASSHLSDAALPSAMICSTGLTLLGVARGKAATEVESLLRKHQDSARAQRNSGPAEG